MTSTDVDDTTVKKIDSRHSPKGKMGQKYLVTGKRVEMRLWEALPAGQDKHETRRDYETVGYVIEGKARLHEGEQTVLLTPGDSWLVPAGVRHSYEIVEPFTAVEATAPPASPHGRDETA